MFIEIHQSRTQKEWGEARESWSFPASYRHKRFSSGIRSYLWHKQNFAGGFLKRRMEKWKIYALFQSAANFHHVQRNLFLLQWLLVGECKRVSFKLGRSWHKTAAAFPPCFQKWLWWHHDSHSRHWRIPSNVFDV